MSVKPEESAKRRASPVEEARPNAKRASCSDEAPSKPAIEEFFQLQACPEDSGILVTYCPINHPTVAIINRALDLADEYDEATKVAANANDRPMGAAMQVRDCINWLLGSVDMRPDAMELERFELGGMLPADFKDWVPQFVIWPPHKFPSHYRFQQRSYACWC